MTDELPPEARLALERGNIIDAIKIVRDRTGLGLKESKDLVERHAGQTPGEPHAPAGGFGGRMDGSPPVVPAAAAAALAQGRKVDAVKIVREATGLGLADTLKLIEGHLKGQRGGAGAPGGAFDPMAEPGRVAPGGGKVWLVIVIALAVLAVGFLFAGA
jgi:hypothetical protein